MASVNMAYLPLLLPWIRQRLAPWLAAAVLALAWLAGGSALAQGVEPAAAEVPTPATLERVARDALPALPAGARVQVLLGQLDARLKLAPCEQIQPYWPGGQRAWGAARVGLRCVQGRTHWNVYLPITVKVFTTVPVAATALAAGTTLEAAHLAEAEVDVAALAHMPLLQAAPVLGRPLARPLAAGQPVTAADLRARQFFVTGDVVRIVARGPGFSVAGEGQALTVGVEGQASRIRTESGRIVTATPVAERQAELLL